MQSVQRERLGRSSKASERVSVEVMSGWPEALRYERLNQPFFFFFSSYLPPSAFPGGLGPDGSTIADTGPAYPGPPGGT